jgi:creatinine amidohydrolase
MNYKHFGSLKAGELEACVSQCPLSFLPLGTLEWHGHHLPLGTDMLIPQGIFSRLAKDIGGVVLPPLFLGPDRVRQEQGNSYLIGMEYAVSTTPPRQLPGNAYWCPKGLFLMLCEQIIEQQKRCGIKCMVAAGHGPSQAAWDEAVPGWEQQDSAT